MDPEVRAGMHRFLSDQPCWFDGCEELRAELKALVDKAVADGASQMDGRNEALRKLSPKIMGAMAPADAGGPPKDRAALLEFFGGGPCDFGGCEELRAEFNAAIVDSSGQPCTSCERGRIVREFMPRVLEAMAKSKKAVA